MRDSLGTATVGMTSRKRWDYDLFPRFAFLDYSNSETAGFAVAEKGCLASSQNTSFQYSTETGIWTIDSIKSRSPPTRYSWWKLSDCAKRKMRVNIMFAF